MVVGKSRFTHVHIIICESKRFFGSYFAKTKRNSCKHHFSKSIHHSAAPVNSLQQFNIKLLSKDVKAADLSVLITSPSGNRLKAHIVNTDDGFQVNFTPTQVGEYLLFVTFCGTPLLTEPYLLKCLKESDPSRVFATGPGLHSGIVNEPAEFVIDTRHSGHGNLGVTVEGPCECHLNCRDNGDGTCNIAYWPTECGSDYTVNITFNNHHIPGSPFNNVTIFPTPDLERVKVSGAGIDFHGKSGEAFVCSRRL